MNIKNFFLSIILGFLFFTIPIHHICANSPDYFTIVALPDTQNYSASYPITFQAQTQWIVDHKDSENIVFVVHEGDIVDNHTIAAQWSNAKAAMDILKSNNIPYSVVPGNHDVSASGQGNSASFDANFPYTDFTGYSWYGGHYPSNSNRNNYEFFSEFGQDYIILNIATSPIFLTEATNWANGILTTHSNRKAIIVTHSLIDSSGQHTDSSHTSGIEVWDNIIKKHNNVIMVICGHAGPQKFSREIGENGNTVQELMANYQDYSNGGNGYLRLYKFYPSSGRVDVKTYSPTLDQYDRSTDGQFSFYIPITSETPVSSNGWWDANWHYRNALYMGASSLSDNLTNFPVKVILDSTKIDFSKVKANGADIRFVDSDNITVLPYEIEYWDDVGQTAVCYVGVPQINAHSNYSDYFYIYYGNSAASDSQNKNSVWNNGQVGVWHINETSGATVYDSTSYANNGTLPFDQGDIAITSCDNTTNWAGTLLSSDATDKQEGSASLVDAIASPVAGHSYDTVYTFPSPANLGTKQIDFWYKNDRANTAFTSTQIILSDGTHTKAYSLGIFNANTWMRKQFNINSSPLDATHVTSLTFRTTAADTTAFKKKIDIVYANGSATWSNGLNFDGGNDYVNFGNPVSLNISSTPFSVQTEFTASITQNNSMIVSKVTGGSNRWHIYLSTTAGTMGQIAVFLSGSGGSSSIYSNVIPTIGQKYYVTVSRDYGNNFTLNVNGTASSKVDTAGNLGNDSASMVMGSYTMPTVSHAFAGTINELRIYNTALTGDHIFASYMSDAGVFLTAGATTEVNTTPPVRSSALPTGTLAAGTTQATISLSTNKSATCKYSAVSGASYASMANVFTTTGATSHSKIITGLSNGSSYTYYVRCQDTAGNVNTNDFTISFSVSSPSCISCGLGTPIITPSSPIANTSFTITCPTNSSGYDCIDAYANGSLNQCTFNGNSGNNVIFNCTGLTTGSYTSRCVAKTGTSRNCCAASQTGSYAIVSPVIPPVIPPGGGAGGGSEPTVISTSTSNIAELQALIQQLLAQVAQLQAQLALQQGTSQFRFLNPLYLGLTSNDVRQLQIFLTSQGTAIYPEAKTTGYYGLLTRKAVIRFQIKYNIIVSEYSPGAGLVGIKTRAKINEMIGN